jgi:hypothetical protein
MQYFYSLTANGFYVDTIHDSIPGDSVAITADHHRVLLDGQANGDRIVANEQGQPVLAAATLAEIKLVKLATLEAARNSAIEQPIISAALGLPHTYAAKAANRQFLNDLVTLGSGGKFTCVDASGVKARRQHTAAQLMQLAHDFQTVIEAHFEHFEELAAEVNAAANSNQLNAIHW